MEIGFDYRASLLQSLMGVRRAEAAAAELAARAEGAFEGALAGGVGEQAAAERFRAAHRAHVDAMTEVAEIEATLEEWALGDVAA